MRIQVLLFCFTTHVFYAIAVLVPTHQELCIQLKPYRDFTALLSQQELQQLYESNQEALKVQLAIENALFSYVRTQDTIKQNILKEQKGVLYRAFFSKSPEELRELTAYGLQYQ